MNEKSRTRVRGYLGVIIIMGTLPRTPVVLLISDGHAPVAEINLTPNRRFIIDASHDRSAHSPAWVRIYIADKSRGQTSTWSLLLLMAEEMQRVN